ncbi:MAG: hypothetical protein IPO88_28275 [Nannocystis sp.]|uniref:GTP-binding protein n=1 Tax=Nannocystis sp. TaxID=1962667 RepID=UPI00242990F0|nr:GTP-binding protein [Nannocystis sp.]MBK9757327.1 hypothetical protein [Nannocystis sp.]
MSEIRQHRPTLAVATIGHHRHGKTTLCSAISRVLARRRPDEVRAVTVAQLDARSGRQAVALPSGRVVRAGLPDELPEPGTESLTTAPSELRYATAQRSYVHIDSPGRRPWLKNAARAQGLVDALILVVSAPDGVQAQTHEHLLLAQALGLRQLVVFLGKCDLVQDGEWLDLVEHDVRELLSRCGFDGDATRIIRGAALPVCAGPSPWEASIADLIEALETELTVPQLRGEGAPLLYIERAFSRRPGLEGVIVDGRVRRGQLRRGDALWLVGFGESSRVVVADLETQRRKVTQVGAGEFAGVLLTRSGAPLRPRDLRSGQALVEPTTRATELLRARVELLPTTEGGRRTAVRDGHLVSLLFGATVVSGRLRLGAQAQLWPGGAAELGIDLVAPVYVEAGMRFLVRDGNQGPVGPRGAPALWGGTAGRGELVGVTPITR